MSDDRAQLRARFPVPADRDLPPGRHLLYRENLMNQILNEPPSSGPGYSDHPSDANHGRGARRSRRPSTRRMLATAAAVVVVAGAGGATAVKLAPHLARVTGPAGGASQGAGTSAPPFVVVQAGSSPVAVLDRIAQATAASPAAKVGPKQYFYIKTESEFAGATGEKTFDSPWVMYPMKTRETWNAQGPGQQSMYRENGTDTPITTGVVDGGTPAPVTSGVAEAATPSGGGSGPTTKVDLHEPTYAYLESLPTDPKALLKVIYQQSHVEGAPDNVEAFQLIGELFTNAILPPKTEAALFRATALIPGVVEVPNSTDAIGRHGLGIALTDQTGERYEWIFSKTTYQYLGERDYQVRTTVNAKKGMLIGLSAVLAKGVSETAGGTPTLIK